MDLGERGDLPIPLTAAVVGGAAVCSVDSCHKNIRK